MHGGFSSEDSSNSSDCLCSCFRALRTWQGLAEHGPVHACRELKRDDDAVVYVEAL
jgi:hypothetical protein